MKPSQSNERKCARFNFKKILKGHKQTLVLYVEYSTKIGKKGGSVSFCFGGSFPFLFVPTVEKKG